MAGYNTTVQTPVLNTPIVYDFPAEAGNLPGKEVYFVLYNQSPYVCEAATAYDKQWCAAFTADAYVVPTQPYPKIIITPQANLGSATPIASQIYGTWYTSKDDIPLTTVPASLFGSTESILVDNPIQLDRRTVAAIDIPFVSDIFDVRRFSSFSLRCFWNAANAGPPANTGLLELIWTDSATPTGDMHSQLYEVNSINSTDCGETRIADRMFGPFMYYTVDPGNGAAAAFDIQLLGSNRQMDKARVQERGDFGFRGMGIDRTVLQVDGVTVTPATNLERNARIGAGSATIVIQTGAGGGSHDVVLYSPEGGINTRYYSANVPAGINNRVERMTLPRRAMALFVNNNGAANSTLWLTVTADGDG